MCIRDSPIAFRFDRWGCEVGCLQRTQGPLLQLCRMVRSAACLSYLAVCLVVETKMCIEVNRSILVVVGSSMVVANSTSEAVLPLAILGKHEGLGRKHHDSRYWSIAAH